MMIMTVNIILGVVVAMTTLKFSPLHSLGLNTTAFKKN